MKRIVTRAGVCVSYSAQGLVLDFQTLADVEQLHSEIKRILKADTQGKGPCWLDDEGRIRTAGPNEGDVVIRGLRGRYLQIVEYLAAHERASTGELYRRFWNRDEYAKEVSQNDVYVYLHRLQRKLLPYGLSVGTDESGRKYLKRI